MGKEVKALALAGQVDPEVHLGFEVSEFGKILDEREKMRYRSLQRTPAAGLDIIKLTEEINRDGQRIHRTWRPTATRLNVFLDRLQSFARIGDILIGGSQNLIASGVWAAVRMALETAVGFLSYFDKISALFMKLGSSWTLHKDFAELFPQCRELQVFLCEYCIVLVQLCTKIVLFSRRSFAKHLAASFFSSFEAEFGPLQAKLEMWGRNIEQKATLMSTKLIVSSESAAAARSRALANRITNTLKQGKSMSRRQRIMDLFSPDQSKYEINWRRERRKGNCRWLFKTPAYSDWKDSKTSEVLWLSGNLGSGKTVALANIVAEVHLDRPSAFFFCTSKEPGTVTARNVVGSIAHQILHSLPSDHSCWKGWDSKVEPLLKTMVTEDVVKLMLAVMPADQRYYIVLDGLEQCPQREIEDVLLALARLLTHRKIALCCSSRPDSGLQLYAARSIKTTHSINLNDLTRDQEIEDFIDTEIERRKLSRPLDPKLEALVKAQLKAGAKGMYLWVALQLDAIFPTFPRRVTSDADIVNIISKLPKDLPEAYDDALGRIVDKRHGSKIFELVAASEHPLTKQELLVALAVVPGSTAWDSLDLSEDAGLTVALCGGSLIEIDEEDEKVRFIHHSAFLHMMSEMPTPNGAESCHFKLEDAELRLGGICVTYLNYGIFDTRVSIQHKIQANNVTQNILSSVSQPNAAVTRMVRLFSHSKRPSAPPVLVDLARVTQDVWAKRMEKDSDMLKCFFEYASNYWLQHTRLFEKSMDGYLWPLWRSLADGDLSYVKLPYKPESHESALTWAVTNSHAGLVQYTFGRDAPTFGDVLLMVEFARDRSWEGKSRQAWMEDAVAQYVSFELTKSSDIDSLINAGADPTRPHRRASSMSGSTPLHMVLMSLTKPTRKKAGPVVHEEVVKALLQDDRVKASLSSAWVPETLVNLIDKGWDEVVLEVLKHKPLVNCERTNSPLGAALRRGKGQPEVSWKKLLVPLLEAGADPLKSFYDNKMSVEIALDADLSDKEMVALLAEADERVLKMKTDAGSTVLWQTVKKNWHSTTKRLVELGADPNHEPHDNLSPLALAINSTDESTAKYLLNKGADPNHVFSESPLRLAIERKNPDIVQELLQRGASPFLQLEGCKTTALVLASRMYFDEGFNKADATKRPPGTLGGERSVLCLLLKHASKHRGVIDASDAEGNTALHYAVKSARYVRLILSFGANPSIANKKGETPMHWALRGWFCFPKTPDPPKPIEPTLPSGSTVDWLKPDKIPRDPDTPLKHSEDRRSILYMLLKAGGDPNATTSRGTSLLHMAVLEGDAEAVNALVFFRANVNPKNSTGVSQAPLEIALSRAKNDMAKILLANGARPLIAMSSPNWFLKPLVKNHALAEHRLMTMGLSNSIPIYDAELFRLLLGQRAISNNASKAECLNGYQSVLAHAICNTLPQVALASLDNGENPNVNVRMPKQFYDERYKPQYFVESALSYVLRSIDRRSYHELAVSLIRHGADVNLATVSTMASKVANEPALAYAMRRGFPDIAALLVRHGADPNVNVEGRPALNLAKEKGWTEVLTLIEEKQAEAKKQAQPPVPRSLLFQPSEYTTAVATTKTITPTTPITKTVRKAEALPA